LVHLGAGLARSLSLGDLSLPTEEEDDDDDEKEKMDAATAGSKDANDDGGILDATFSQWLNTYIDMTFSAKQL
jgi:hypothetical protein